MTKSELIEYIEQQISRLKRAKKEGFFSDYGAGTLDTFIEILDKLKKI